MGKIFVLNEDGIDELLRTALVGRIAYATPDAHGGRPFIVPIAYGYDGTGAYLVGPPGQKVHIMRRQPLVSFEVDTAEAEDRWRSACCEGVYEELTNPTDRAYGLDVIFGDRPRPDIPQTHVVFRIRFTARTGRFELPDDEAAAYERQLAGA